jgi:hypothetical protein
MTIPKKLWIDPDYLDGETDCISRVKVLDRDFQYIRADLVAGLVEALGDLVKGGESMGWESVIKVIIALEALEEE